MIRKITAFLVAAAAVAALASCAPKTNPVEDGRLKVSVSFNALKEFTAAVGGDKVNISVIIPDGTEPHSFEPKAQDLAALGSAELLIINGLGMEPWADNAVSVSKNSELLVIEASTGVDTIATDAHEDEHAEDHDEEGSEHHVHGAIDPHIWLSLKCAQTVAANIKDALVSIDPENASYYQSNCDNFTAQLNQLYTEYDGKFASVNKKSFVTGHAAFGYLCRDFGLTQNSVEDVFAEGEPSAQQLAALVNYCKENNVTTVFSEALMNPDIADTLARESGATVQAIYTIASSENDQSYLERMEENLSAIYESMK